VLGVPPDAAWLTVSDPVHMGSQYTIAWHDPAGFRVVGRLVLSPESVTLEGTETAQPRRSALMRADRSSMRTARVVRNGELPAVQIETPSGPLVVELVTGGRGAALALVDELSADAA
jgi:hypothetical protein